MLKFLARRLGIMVLTMFCLSLVVFFFVNLEPNLKRLARFKCATFRQIEMVRPPKSTPPHPLPAKRVKG